jgi:hypothetical protein
VGHVEQVDCLALATICDPRYKRQGFKEEAATRAVRKLKEEMRNQAVAVEGAELPDEAAAVPDSRSSLWGDFDKEVTRRRQEPHIGNEDAVFTEVVKYLKLQNMPRKSNPLLVEHNWKGIVPSPPCGCHEDADYSWYKCAL